MGGAAQEEAGAVGVGVAQRLEATLISCPLWHDCIICGKIMIHRHPERSDESAFPLAFWQERIPSSLG
jgi:hypothetical protein